ncbi:MAG: hypothetical protein ABW224_16420 [Kibdelosporangium sp.]
MGTITPDLVARLLRALLDLGLVDRIDQSLTSHRLIRETNRQHVEAEPEVDQHAVVLAGLVDVATNLHPCCQWRTRSGVWLPCHDNSVSVRTRELSAP